MLQLIAMATMLIDHIGYIFFPDSQLYRIVGRLAFPLYCWFLVQGYLHTRNLKNYMYRLFGLACLSQIPYNLAFQQVEELNVIFTLLLSIIALYILDHVEGYRLKSILLLGVMSTAILVPMDYGLYGVALVLIYRYLDQRRLVRYHMLLNLFFFAAYGIGYWIQFFSIFATILIGLPYSYRFMPRIKPLYRSFYPLHLAVLFVISMWLGR